MTEKSNPVRDKSYLFALSIISLYRILIRKREYDIGRQVLRSGTSIGANIREGLQGQSRNDFIARLSIALKEAHETLYWLSLIRDAGIMQSAHLSPLLKNVDELICLLTAIIKSSRN
jgi:four helix bundle protein